jgi:hypothetical protein
LGFCSVAKGAERAGDKSLVLMGMMLNTSATTMIPAAAGYEVISIEVAGELARWPIIGSAVVPAYGYGLGGSIIPVVLGAAFDPDLHAIAMPDGRTLSTSAVSEALAARAWHAAGVPTAHQEADI